MKKLMGFLVIALIATSALLLACGSSDEMPRLERAILTGQQGSSGADGAFGAAGGAMESEDYLMTRESYGLSQSPLTRGISLIGDTFTDNNAAAIARPAAMATATPAPMAPGSQMPAPEGGEGSGKNALQTVGRKVISIARVSIEVEAVEPSVGQIRAIAESVGGFVEQLSSSGGSENPRAELTVRVPQDQFEPALGRIEGLGDVESRNLGSEDVTEQFIDLSARLRSSKREEESLLALLERSSTVTEILTVERELARVRSDIERAQGQLNFLERRVDLATIHVSLFPPGARPTNPPVASYRLDVSDVSERVARLKDFVAGLGGEIDQVYLATYEHEERAEVAFRVFVQDFDRTAEFIEDQGKVKFRELREGINPLGAGTPRAKRPDARVEVTYVDRSFRLNWLAPVIIIVVVLALAGVVAYLMRLTYRRGRTRGSFI